MHARGAGSVIERLGEQVRFTISFSIAAELRDAALSGGARQDEFTALVIVIFVTLEFVRRGVNYLSKMITKEGQRNSTIFGFTDNFIDSASTISLSLAVQLMARAVASADVKLSTRVVSLIAVIFFFSYVESGGKLLSSKESD